VVLVNRLSEALRRLNPDIPSEAREEALRKVLRVPKKKSPLALGGISLAELVEWTTTDSAFGSNRLVGRRIFS